MEASTFRSIASDLPTGKARLRPRGSSGPGESRISFSSAPTSGPTSPPTWEGTGRSSWRAFPPFRSMISRSIPGTGSSLPRTHGRSIWIVDIAPLQELTAQVASSDVHLFQPKPGLQFGNRPIGGESTGHQVFEAPSPPLRGGDRLLDRGEREPPGGWRPLPGTGAEGTGSPGRQSGRWSRRPSGQGTPGGDRHPRCHRGHGPYRDLCGNTGPPSLPVELQREAEAPAAEARAQDRGADPGQHCQAVARVNELVDSLVEAGSDRAQLEEFRDMILSGGRGGMAAAFGGGGGGGRGGGQADPDAWVERPGESFLPGAVAAAASRPR